MPHLAVVVPTYRRHSNGESQTFRNVPNDFPLILAVRGEEYDSYVKLLKQLDRTEDTIWSIPSGQVSGIATTRQWIVNTARDYKYDHLIMMDDDLHFIVRGKIPNDDVHLRECEPIDFRNMIDWMDWNLDKYAHVAISMREGNNRFPGLNVAMDTSRGIRVTGYDLHILKETGIQFRDIVEGREDLDMTLQLLRAGYPNLVSYHYAQGQRTADAPGGLQGTRTAEQLDGSARTLADLHPGFVKLRTKINKTGGMAGERTEVTIYWKKALASGQHVSHS